MNLTIQTVDTATRTWEGPKGTIEFIQGQFTNGEGWSLGAKPENAQKRVEELTKLIGVEGDYEIEAKGEYQGKKQWKMKSWPGKPVFGGGSKAPRDETGMAIGAAGHDAAVLVAAMVEAKTLPSVDAFDMYASLVGRIYENNQQLRATTTPPGVASAAGAGSGLQPPTHDPVPTTSPADKKADTKTAGSKELGAAGDEEWGAKPTGDGQAPCSNYADHTFKKQGDKLICSKCGVNRT